MKLKSAKKLRKRKSRTFLVLPLLENNNNNNVEERKMPKNPGLKLFTKTWPAKRDKDQDADEDSRPLTATLERPAVLDINLLGKVDMSTVTKEFLNIGNLCRIPLGGAAATGNKRRKSRPLSLPAAQKKAPAGKKRNRRCETSESSWEEEESLRSAGRHPKQSRPGNGALAGAPRKKPLSDPNNNNNTRVPRGQRGRVHHLNGGKVLNVKIELEGKTVSTARLPEPCKTCGRPDQPERFHSHPATPVKPLRKLEVPAKIPVKSTVQKPIAMRYKSKQATENKVPAQRRPSQLPAQKLAHTPPSLDNKETSLAQKSNVIIKDPVPAQKMVHTPPSLGNREATAAHKIAHTPPGLGNRDAISAHKMAHTPPGLVNREATPVHKIARTPPGLGNRQAISAHKTAHTPPSLGIREAVPAQIIVRSPATSEASNSLTQEARKSATRVRSAKRTLTCYLCGREFGSASLPLHEPKCLQKWKRENANLPEHLRRKPPRKPDHPLSQEEWDKFAWETAQAQLIPCDRCGRTFFPDRLAVHQRSCKETGNTVNVFFEAVPPAVLGGWFVMFMGLFSYISSITSLETRTLRIGAVNVFANISITMGTALSGLLFAVLGFYGIFSLALALYLLGILYICVVVKERPAKRDPADKKNFVADFFDWRHVADTFRTVFRDDKRHKRRRVAFVMALAVVIIGPVHGEMNISYMFVRHKFHWDEIDYSIYTTYHFIVHFIGTVFSLTFFSKYLKLDDALLGIISCTSKVLACAIYAFAPTPFYFYVGALVEILNGTSFIALRSIVTKLVKTAELGKINSLFGMFEALAPIVYGPLYSIIYQNTIEVLPGAFYIAGGLLTLPAIGIFFWLYRQSKIDHRETKLATGESLLKDDVKVDSNNEFKNGQIN